MFSLPLLIVIISDYLYVNSKLGCSVNHANLHPADKVYLWFLNRKHKKHDYFEVFFIICIFGSFHHHVTAAQLLKWLVYNLVFPAKIK